MADNNVKKWYVVRAVSGQENKVKAYIETEINRLGMSDYISQLAKSRAACAVLTSTIVARPASNFA